MAERRLRIFDLNTPWFWIVLFWQERRLVVRVYPSNRWAGWWLHAFKREPIPDERGEATQEDAE